MKPTTEQIEAWLKSDDSWSELIAVAYAAGAAAMQERCAKVCDAQRNVIIKKHPARIEFDPNDYMAAKCAALIRVLGDEE